jgi:hypothetical protein
MFVPSQGSGSFQAVTSDWTPQDAWYWPNEATELTQRYVSSTHLYVGGTPTTNDSHVVASWTVPADRRWEMGFCHIRTHKEGTPPGAGQFTGLFNWYSSEQAEDTVMTPGTSQNEAIANHHLGVWLPPGTVVRAWLYINPGLTLSSLTYEMSCLVHEHQS